MCIFQSFTNLTRSACRIMLALSNKDGVQRLLKVVGDKVALDLKEPNGTPNGTPKEPRMEMSAENVKEPKETSAKNVKESPELISLGELELNKPSLKKLRRKKIIKTKRKAKTNTIDIQEEKRRVEAVENIMDARDARDARDALDSSDSSDKFGDSFRYAEEPSAPSVRTMENEEEDADVRRTLPIYELLLDCKLLQKSYSGNLIPACPTDCVVTKFKEKMANPNLNERDLKHMKAAFVQYEDKYAKAKAQIAGQRGRWNFVSHIVDDEAQEGDLDDDDRRAIAQSRALKLQPASITSVYDVKDNEPDEYEINDFCVDDADIPRKNDDASKDMSVVQLQKVQSIRLKRLKKKRKNMLRLKKRLKMEMKRELKRKCNAIDAYEEEDDKIAQTIKRKNTKKREGVSSEGKGVANKRKVSKQKESSKQKKRSEGRNGGKRSSEASEASESSEDMPFGVILTVEQSESPKGKEEMYE